MSKATTDPEMLDPDEVAGIMRVCKATVLRMLLAGRLPGFKVGKAWRVPRRELDRWIADKVAANVKPPKGRGGRHA